MASMAMAMAMAMALLVASVQGMDDRVADLERRQGIAKDGVVVLDDGDVKVLAASPDRPYALLVFFDALHLKERSELKLEELKKEFVVMAQTYIKNNAIGEGKSKIFFCSIEFQRSQASFATFGVNSLPHIRYLPPGSCSLNESESMEMGESSRSAEGMSSFVEARSKYKVGQIQRPPLLSKKQLVLVVGVLAAVIPFVIRQLVQQGGKTPFHSSKLWCIGSLLVYFFSVSGGMHNIIRKMPMFMMDRKDPSKLVFFYQGSGMQLGAEGFAVGSLYTLVGLAIALITHALAPFSSKFTRRLFMFLALLVCYWAVTKVVALNHWKTGYEVHLYLPTFLTK